MSTRFVRAANEIDAARITQIYNEGIEDRVATFQTVPRREADILDWMVNERPIQLAGEAGTVMAFAVAHPHNGAAYYDGVREFPIYAAREARGRGFARAALGELIADAKSRGWWKLLSRVFPENAASRELLASLGFREVGIYAKHGQLDGQWRDVIIVEKLLI